jgi:hypothetical protein
MARNWIIAHDSTHGDDAYAMECLRCKTKQRFSCPLDIDIWLAAARVFQRQHAQCREPAADPAAMNDRSHCDRLGRQVVFCATCPRCGEACESGMCHQCGILWEKVAAPNPELGVDPAADSD